MSEMHLALHLDPEEQVIRASTLAHAFRRFAHLLQTLHELVPQEKLDSPENRDPPLLGGSLQVLQFDLIAKRFEPFHQTARDSIAVEPIEVVLAKLSVV